MANDLKNLSIGLASNNTKKQDRAFQSLADSNPELADAAMTAKGYGTISSDTLKPAETFTVTQPKTATTATGMLAGFEVPSYTDALNKKANTAETTKNTSLQSYLDALAAPGKTQLTANAYGAKGGVDAIQPELDSINQELLQEQHSLRRRLEAIDAKGGGLQSGAQTEKYNIERESLRKQADLSIIQMGIQGRFDSAKAIADRAVSAQLEADINKQNALFTIYQDNKSQFDKAEQRAFEVAHSEREREIQNQKDEETRRYNLAIDVMKAGAPASVVKTMMSGSLLDALSVGGAYLAPKEKKEATKWDVKSVNGTDMLFNPATGELKPIGANVSDPKNQAIADQAQATLDRIASIEKSTALDSAVGPVGIARIALTDALFGAQDNFLADVAQLTSQQTLDALTTLKAKGGTLGALSEKELAILKSSASAISSREITDNGNVVGYDMTEEKFKSELKKYKELVKKAQINALGYDPAILPSEDSNAIDTFITAGSTSFSADSYFEK